MFKSLLLAGLTALIVTPAFARPDSTNADCVIFEHRKRKGEYLFLEHNQILIGRKRAEAGNRGVGNHNPIYSKWWNKKISSVIVNKPCTLMLYDTFENGGKSLTLQTHRANLPDGWNDKASRALCTCSNRK